MMAFRQREFTHGLEVSSHWKWLKACCCCYKGTAETPVETFQAVVATSVATFGDCRQMQMGIHHQPSLIGRPASTSDPEGFLLADLSPFDSSLCLSVSEPLDCYDVASQTVLSIDARIRCANCSKPPRPTDGVWELITASAPASSIGFWHLHFKLKGLTCTDSAGKSHPLRHFNTASGTEFVLADGMLKLVGEQLRYISSRNQVLWYVRARPCARTHPSESGTGTSTQTTQSNWQSSYAKPASKVSLCTFCSVLYQASSDFAGCWVPDEASHEFGQGFMKGWHFIIVGPWAFASPGMRFLVSHERNRMILLGVKLRCHENQLFAGPFRWRRSSEAQQAFADIHDITLPDSFSTPSSRPSGGSVSGTWLMSPNSLSFATTRLEVIRIGKRHWVDTRGVQHKLRLSRRSADSDRHLLLCNWRIWADGDSLHGICPKGCCISWRRQSTEDNYFIVDP